MIDRKHTSGLSAATVPSGLSRVVGSVQVKRLSQFVHFRGAQILAAERFKVSSGRRGEVVEVVFVAPGGGDVVEGVSEDVVIQVVPGGHGTGIVRAVHFDAAGHAVEHYVHDDFGAAVGVVEVGQVACERREHLGDAGA